MRFQNLWLVVGGWFVGLLAVVVLSIPARVVAADKEAAPALVDVTRSAASGPWSQPATWVGGKVPGAGARVLIQTGHRVAYDVQSDAVLRAMRIAGTLSFAPDRDTRLNIGLIKIELGDDVSEDGFDCDDHGAEPGDAANPAARPALLVGTPERPIDAGKTALIRLVHQAGMDINSCPAIVCCGGRMEFHGAPLNRSWVKLGATVKPGDAVVTLAETVSGWRVGDRVIVTATSRYESKGREKRTEERVIQTIDDSRTKLTLDKPLEFEHSGDGDFRGELANLSRNVIVESADPAGVRGHTMYHRGSAGSIHHAEFRHLGKEGTLGRYSLHFHLIGDTMRGSSVIGNSIWDSGNRWLTIHGTNYLVVRDNVGYGSVGHGFFLEDGTEIYNVLDRNLAVGARPGKRLPKQVLPFDGNEGAGFWWANSLNSFTRNVAVANGNYGFRYEATPTSALKLVFRIRQPDGSEKEVDIRTLPFVRFEDNEVHSSVGLYGCNLGEGVNRVGPDTKHPFVVRNLKIWDVHYAFRPQVPSLLVENLTIWHAAYGVYHPHFQDHVYRNVSITKTDTEPFNRGHDDLSAQYGALTVDGLTFDGIRGGDHMPLIQISDDNPTGAGVTHIRGLKTINWTGSRNRAMVNLGGGPRPTPKTEHGVPIYVHDYFGTGRHAKVVSTKAKDTPADGLTYRAESPLTGDESRAAEVRDVEFPTLLNPIDDLPPVSVITHVQPASGGKLLVRGTTSDNGTVSRVVVNGRPAKSQANNFGEWEIEIAAPAGWLGANAASHQPGRSTIKAHAVDAAGNVEKTPHEVRGNEF
ncbi:MAG: G8 domain-containing protein [Planctomycetales bacterium]|nr:G8 domain-containing protein [Planctomycetales bacterium]